MEGNREYVDRSVLGATCLGFTFYILLPATSPASIQLAMPSSFFFPAHCTFAADDNLWPEYRPRPARPGHVEGQKIYKPALSSPFNQQRGFFLPAIPKERPRRPGEPGAAGWNPGEINGTTQKRVPSPWGQGKNEFVKEKAGWRRGVVSAEPNPPFL